MPTKKPTNLKYHVVRLTRADGTRLKSPILRDRLRETDYALVESHAGGSCEYVLLHVEAHGVRYYPEEFRFVDVPLGEVITPKPLTAPEVGVLMQRKVLSKTAEGTPHPLLALIAASSPPVLTARPYDVPVAG